MRVFPLVSGTTAQTKPAVKAQRRAWKMKSEWMPRWWMMSGTAWTSPNTVTRLGKDLATPGHLASMTRQDPAALECGGKSSQRKAQGTGPTPRP